MANASSPSIPSVGDLVECVGAVGWHGTARIIECPLSHRNTQSGHVWVREVGLHLRRGMEAFVVEWPIKRIRVVR